MRWAAVPARRVLARRGRPAARGPARGAPRVLDVGGGSGAWAVPLAGLGCAVTVVDNSPNALAALQRRARDAGRARAGHAVQGDVDALADVVPAGGGRPRARATACSRSSTTPRPRSRRWPAAADAGARGVGAGRRPLRGGAGPHAGRPAGRGAGPAHRSGRPVRPGRRAAPPAGRRRAAGAPRGTAACGWRSCRATGCWSGWVPGSVRDGGPAAARAVAELEELAAAAGPLRDVAARLHALARRPPDGRPGRRRVPRTARTARLTRPTVRST